MNQNIALTIAGSDSSAGAGIQADLKTFSSFGLHGLNVVTSIVSETPLIVNEIHSVPPVMLQDQLRLLLRTYPVRAIKTGMLFSKAHIVAVFELLESLEIPIVVDPVMVASTGDSLLRDDALVALKERLLPKATVITPNLPEAGLLLGRDIQTEEEQDEAAKELSERFSCACYLKGGHFENVNQHRDLLFYEGSQHPFFSDHLDLPQTHGTGCTLAAAFTSGLAKGQTIPEAAKTAHQFTNEALKKASIWDHATTDGLKVAHLQQTLTGYAD